MSYNKGFYNESQSNNSNYQYNKFSGSNNNNYNNYQTRDDSYNNSSKDWSYRYGRNGTIRNNIIQEDEEFFQEHVLAMNKKKCIFI